MQSPGSLKQTKFPPKKFFKPKENISYPYIINFLNEKIFYTYLKKTIFYPKKKNFVLTQKLLNFQAKNLSHLSSFSQPPKDNNFLPPKMSRILAPEKQFSTQRKDFLYYLP